MIETLAKRLVGNVGLYVAGGLAAALLLSLLGNWLLWRSRDAALTTSGAATASLETCTSSNKGAQETIDDLTMRLGRCVGQAQATDALTATLDEKLAAQAADITKRVSANQRAREQAYATPSCDALRRVPVCRDLDGRLRDHARRGGANPND